MHMHRVCSTAYWSKQMDQLGMDFVGPISPPSISGNQYILTMLDYFSKLAWAKALRTKEAVNVMDAIREI